MLKSLISYVRDYEFSVTICKNKINVVNFKEIIVMEDNKIVLSSNYNKITIKGNNLTINKLLDNELLIMGEFSSIELGE